MNYLCTKRYGNNWVIHWRIQVIISSKNPLKDFIILGRNTSHKLLHVRSAAGVYFISTESDMSKQTQTQH